MSIVAVVVTLTSATAHATLTTGLMITRIGGDLRNNELFALQFDRDINNGVCERNNVLYLDPSNAAQRALIAVAITAQVQGSTVTVIDSATCDEVFNGSSVGNVDLIFADQ